MAGTEKARGFKQALKIIAPDRERLKECERDLAEALRLVEVAVKIDKSGLTPAERSKIFRDLATTLRRAINLATRAVYEEYTPRRTPWDARIDGLKCFLEETNRAADDVSKFEVGKGAPQRSKARMAAVWQAYNLIEKYGSAATLYRDGQWHELARVLLGNKKADLLDYMRVCRKIIECGTE